MKVAIIATVYNESASIDQLLESLATGSKVPDEIVITDAGSTDGTWPKLQSWATKLPNLKILQISGNRSVGRNKAFELTSVEIVAVTDAGVRIDPQWLEEIITPFLDPTVGMVAGFYHCEADTAFEQGMCAYTATMPDQLNLQTFLPSARSMALRKSVWEKSGGWDEQLRFNEDLPYDYKLKAMGVKIGVAPKALVYWRPRRSWLAAWKQFSAYARGDAESLIFSAARAKVWTIFGRYLLGLALVIWLIQAGAVWIAVLLAGSYAGYALYKNGRYVRSPQRYLILPTLQVWSDLAVMWGTLVGLVGRMKI